MLGTRTVLMSGLLALACILDASGANAADECLAKPEGPTPQGQHWYYRTDRASGRQCWYLRAENAHAQKAERETETDSSDVEKKTRGAVQQDMPAEVPKQPPEKNAPVAAAPAYWPSVARTEPVSFLQPIFPARPKLPTDAAPPALPVPSASTARDNAAGHAPPVADQEAAAARSEQQRPARERRRHLPMKPDEKHPAAAAADIDHTFSVLMVLFAVLAITGPILHFIERRRRKKVSHFQPPPYARVVSLNAPPPRVRVDLPVRSSQPMPLPARSSEHTERLARALQQVVDRLQTAPEPQIQKKSA
ncbi:MAG TPA: hypothetical protein VFB29_12440 [Pseudolabrys sp.]|nr:hypothetical protein [Pseudolabrys sp.]